jgi:hypothetical protein
VEVGVLVVAAITDEMVDRVAVVRQTDILHLTVTVTAQQVKEMRAGIMFTGMRLVAAVVLEEQDMMAFPTRQRQEAVATAVMG